MLRGEPIWHTSSTGPMSIPSSSDAVATSARRSPARRRVSTRYRRSFERLPWCAATTSSPRRSPSWCASRSASRRVLTNTSVVRCSLDQRGDAVEHVAHLLGRRDRLQLSLGQLEREVEVALVTGVDDRRAADGRRRAAGRRSRSDAAWPRARSGGAGVAQRLEPLEGEREVRAALVARDGVDLVDDDRLDRAQELPTLVAGDEQVERLGRGDHEARRLAQHGGALRRSWCRRCAPRRGCRARSSPSSAATSAISRERAFEVLGDVDGERLQRRDVDDAGEPVDRLAALVGAVEAVDADEEAGERLARAGGRGDQRVAARRRSWGQPSRLRRGRALGEAAPEPLGDGGVEAAQRRVQGLAAVELGGEQREGQRGHSFIVADGYDTHQGDLRKRRRLRGPRSRRNSHGQDHRSRRRRRRAHPSVVALARARCRGRRARAPPSTAIGS